MDDFLEGEGVHYSDLFRLVVRAYSKRDEDKPAYAPSISAAYAVACNR